MDSFMKKKMRAVSKSRVFIMAILLLMVFGTMSCTKKAVDENDLSTEQEVEEDVKEEVITNEQVEEDVKEEVVEIAPLKRETTLTGGTLVVTPEGDYLEELDLTLTDAMQVGYLELNGLEWRRSYDVSFKGSVSQQSLVNIYLLDGNKIDVASFELTKEFITNQLEEKQSIILDHTEIEVSDIFEVKKRLTNKIASTNKGLLYISINQKDDSIKLSDISVKRHIGELKFSDEFEYEGLLNDQWKYEVGGNGWGNGELQYYTGEDLDNAKVTDGKLVITAIEEEINNNDYSSARVRTKDNFVYGRYEISAKLPLGRGTWPAIWMLPAGNNYGGWPHSGEIDIMEHVGFDMDVVHGSLHMSEFNFRKNNHPTSVMTIPEIDTSFHTYVLEWTPYQMDMYVDGYHYMSFKNDGQGPKHWPFDEKFYMLINIAVGGAWGAQQGIDPVFPQQLEIDYVRIYDLEDEVKDTIAPNAVDLVDVNIQGSVVQLSFDPVEDDYKVGSYLAKFTGNNQIVEQVLYTTSGLILDLKGDSEYLLQLYSVDESGNMSLPYETTVMTQVSVVNDVNEWITPEQSYFVNGASIIDEEGNQVIAGFEKDHLMGYAFDVKAKGNYRLELEISGKLFDGEVMLLNDKNEELLSFIATKTGAKNVYEVVMTDVFELEAMKQVLFLKTVKNGYQIKNVKLSKVD